MFLFRPVFYRLFKLHPGRRLLYLVALLVFFWAFFDGMLSYLVPVLITQRGYSNTQMGFIFAFSSVAGAVFDFLLSRFLKNTNYLRTFFLMLLIALSFPLVLWFSSNLFVYLLAMAVWGLYYDLYTFSSYDFVSRHGEAEGHCFNFGIIDLFRAVAGFLAPLVASLFIINKVELFNISFPLAFLIAALILYLLLFNLSPLHYFHSSKRFVRSANFFTEFRLWRSVARVLFPVLFFIVLINIFDATFWTIGPLFSSSFPEFKHFSGFIMMLYNLPAVFTVWKVEAVARKFGKKKTAFFSFLLANLFLIPLSFINSPYLTLFCIFLSTTACSFTWPAIEGAFTDYVSESGRYESEIEGLTDFTTNLGYVFGPILSGLFSDKIGISHSFALIGLINVCLVIFLLFITPKQINVVLKRS